MYPVSEQILNIFVADEARTNRLANDIAMALRPGDLVGLEGDLGVGKTTLARALIRAAADNDLLEVPSPTFTLVQTYPDLPFGSLAHFDLYRITHPSELDELGLEEALELGAAVVEWPQNAQGSLSEPSLSLSITAGTDDQSRNITIAGKAEAVGRLERSLLIRRFLEENDYGDARRVHLTGDASTRSYETIQSGTETDVILMNAPEQPDGPPIRDGKPYSQIAHLAENMRAFVGVDLLLEANGFRVPEIFSHDIAAGLLLIENLGTDGIIDADRKPRRDRYLACAETLAALHQKPWSDSVSLPDGSTHHVPPFDEGVLMIETGLLAQWYAPYRLGRSLSNDELEAFETCWRNLGKCLEKAPASLLLRDFHSPNIIWCDAASGVSRVGLIDFQDALMGPSAYDLASIAQDARVDVPADLEIAMVDHYCKCRGDEAGFGEQSFREAYSIMAAQRATKVLGIFVRLSKRDGKHIYLDHLPRLEEYITRSLSHPVLADYRIWLRRVLNLGGEVPDQ